MIQHHTYSPYHPQANGMVEAFNKIMEREQTVLCLWICLWSRITWFFNGIKIEVISNITGPL